MEDRVIFAALAGLLHDVGKIEQRAQDAPWNPPEGYNPEGQPVHAGWTEYFIQHSVPAAYHRPALQGVYHHRPEDSPAEDRRLGWVVSLADKLSAGERADDEPAGPGNRPPQQMLSIFDRVGAYRDRPGLAHHYLPLSELRLAREALFPVGQSSPDDTRRLYEALRDRLREEARNDPGDAETYLENLLGAFQRNAWSIPSAYYHSMPDVSLYDHARMTAALAVCVDELPDQQIIRLVEALRADFAHAATPEQKTMLDAPVALLVGGDISGIQSFIYTLSARRAAQTLRGRSFYLQLLNEAILRYVLRELGIPLTNVIYAGGGHFYLLAPLSAAKKLPDLQRQITRTLLKHHGTGLYMALGWAEVPASGFSIGRFSRTWDRMHAALRRVKQQKYRELGEDLREVFRVQPHGGNQEKLCSVCGEEKEDCQPLEDEPGEELGRICGLCASFFRAFGRRLPEASYALLTLGAPQPREAGSALDVLAEFGLGIQFYDANRRLLPDGAELPGAERGVLWALDDPRGWPEVSLPAARGLRYTVNRVPHETFDKLQERSHGMKRLGVLRMDVDDLGALFRAGFGEGEKSIATVARLSTLSFQLSVFFEGWVKRICEEVSGDRIYAVYSGGDDLFLIAPWHLVPGLARRIAEDFSQYASANPDVHISGGMAFIHGKYPVYQAAEDAHDALEQAKQRPGKRSFAFLGEAWGWDEFAALEQRFTTLVQVIQEQGGPHSLLQVLQRLADLYRSRRGGGNRPLWGPWMWLGDYQLKRMIEQAKNKPDLRASLQEIYAELSPLYHSLPLWGKAARWAQLYLRNDKEESR
ncbi:MAG TPA: type III-A CRISPR-associated protein Cas10/Csm1 [Anaerolinea thermolimosa]|uniref:CRISPR system single-strand-specific deoxyribonuclease Cas10/Csm1 (subtype III-A) n=1 Tax=Anaerolinea thermolimosa TaxID=229919 RepID=A0A3D1JKJ0_9CHLR|nr:type III-A CRISPR-associated protein Cas10/Csm1 [Anaerolinea thermolimosa]GAP05374.1 CRISPR-associated protein, Csm1 family [Anaerolinea thermolimosa]HCE18268.1 type III-A CRISPR-associated protein Cas10/Csm1 [Anaerolinea thermolimosa]